MRTQRDRVIDLLRYCVSEERFAHCRRVAACCRTISEHYDLNSSACELVGWAHDLAREWSPSALLDFVVRVDPQGIDPVEAEEPTLLHGHVASIVVARDLGVSDSCLLEAIRYHTLGKSEFCSFGKVLYCADYLEPARPSVPDELRRAVGAVTLDELVRLVITDTRRRGYAISERTEAMYQSVEKGSR